MVLLCPCAVGQQPRPAAPSSSACYALLLLLAQSEGRVSSRMSFLVLSCGRMLLEEALKSGGADWQQQELSHCLWMSDLFHGVWEQTR